MYVCVYVCMYVCMYACMHACMYVCLRVCMYVCTYADINRLHVNNQALLSAASCARCIMMLTPVGVVVRFFHLFLGTALWGILLVLVEASANFWTTNGC